MSDETAADPGAKFEVVGGNPTAEELAALVSVLTVVTSPVPPPPDNVPYMGGWRSYWRTLRQPVYPGRDAWQHYRT
ncbi:acyl-CoA carboxylase subunit epsilon [Enemella sp. A6]|uniref:acyl-CoA carboxylase subunit epsilon n=1 Tax=Enemella sp. A6 TaxID=3440152 RepID=UPI003EBB8AAE